MDEIRKLLREFWLEKTDGATHACTLDARHLKKYVKKFREATRPLSLMFKHGIKVVAKESSDDPPLGVIVDVYHKDELLDTITIWYKDLKN